jgi:hypothetical protein
MQTILALGNRTQAELTSVPESEVSKGFQFLNNNYELTFRELACLVAGTLTSHTFQRKSAGQNNMRPGTPHLRRLKV